MQTLRVLIVLCVVCMAILVYALWGRAGRERAAISVPAEPAIPVSKLAAVHPVKQIDLEYHQPDLPPGPGHDVFAAQCVICHSPRYVLNQPVFPRKIWAAEVHKMVQAYGAPIDSGQEKDIVNYLVSWHGKEDAPTRSASPLK